MHKFSGFLSSCPEENRSLTGRTGGRGGKKGESPCSIERAFPMKKISPLCMKVVFYP